ncbi:hypothetical protein AGMMS50267_06090 [Spirochaetia bacterium]|nr:hypothetical protein AGMMS50267_06090 [Spirochaetia bacterium]
MKPQINVMILGQTGTGKSTLINYLYGDEIVKAGTGKPVTGRGEFKKITVASPLKPDVKINIFDSWGLESNKADDWKNVINTKLSSTLSFDEMVYGIVYCMSYSNDRIQDFEIEMLRELLNKKYKVIIALTNADNGGYETKKTVFREKLVKDLPEYKQLYSVVDICAQAKAKIGQPVSNTAAFGKETLFKELDDNFYENFKKVLFAQWTAWKDESIENLDNFRQAGTARIIEFKRDGVFGTKLPFGTKLHTANTINIAIEQELQKVTTDIFEKIKDGMNDAQQLYEHFTGAFFKTERSKELLAKDFFDKIGLQINQAVHFGAKKFELQQKLAEDLDKAIRSIDKKIHEIYGEAQKLFWELERNKTG